MIKAIAFVARHPTLTADEFHMRWRADHAPLVAANPAASEHLVRYELNHRKPRDYERSEVPYDGVAVQWYDSWDGMLAMLADERYRPVVADQTSLLDPHRLLTIFTEPEQVVIAPTAATPAATTKLICALRRRAGATPDEFRDHWRDIHGPLNRDTPGIARHILRYEQNLARPGSEHDGVTIQWFANTHEFFAMAGEPEYGSVIEPDETRLLDRGTLVWLLTEPEEVVLDGGSPASSC